jgi:hypothetical protein
VVVSLATVSVVTWALLNSGQERPAALIYQHATRERDEEIATAMGRCSPRSGGRALLGADRAPNRHDGRERLLDGYPGVWRTPGLSWGFWLERAKESNPHDQLGRSVTLNRREQD